MSEESSNSFGESMKPTRKYVIQYSYYEWTRKKFWDLWAAGPTLKQRKRVRRKE